MAERADPLASAPVGEAHRIPGLDGLRAIAILLVVASHVRATPGFPPRLAGDRFYDGGLGVDVFFAISGFLITWLLLDEEERLERIRLKRFYYRRALRILPAALAYLATVMLLDVLWKDVAPAGDLLAALTFCRNLFGDSPATAHFWSLSVEEQFYLVWPALFFVVPTRRRLPTALALLALAPLWRIFNLEVLRPPHGLNLGRADLHYDAIAAGVVLALARRAPWGGRLYACMRARGAAVLGASIVALSTIPALHGPMTPVAMSGRNLLLAAIVLAAATDPGPLARRVLDSAPLRYVGRLSYSLYLWQQLFLFWWRIDGGWLGRFPVDLVASGLAAAASYHFVERPVLAWRDRAARGSRQALAGRPPPGVRGRAGALRQRP